MSMSIAETGFGVFAAPAGGAAAGEWAVDLTDVTKVYRGGVHALRGIEMKVRRGEIFGLLGPNGAGKSTLVKILMTVIAATRAQGTVLGQPVGNKDTLSKVGYLPEHHRFPEYLTGGQVLDFYGAMCGVDRATRRQRAGTLLDLVGMTAWERKRVKGYSKGMRQRIGIAQSLMNDPSLVVLDEPTDGVDPVGRRDIRNMMTTLKDRGITVFLNSHLLSELEAVSDRVAILVKGKVVSQGTIDELTAGRQYYEIEIDAPDAQSQQPTFLKALPMGSTLEQSGHESSAAESPPNSADQPSSIQVTSRNLGGGDGNGGRQLAPDASGLLPSGEKILLRGGTLQILTSDHHPIQAVIDGLRQRGVAIRSVRPVRPTLEDLFMEAVVDPTTGKAFTPGAAENEGAGR